LSHLINSSLKMFRLNLTLFTIEMSTIFCLLHDIIFENALIFQGFHDHGRVLTAPVQTM